MLFFVKKNFLEKIGNLFLNFGFLKFFFFFEKYIFFFIYLERKKRIFFF
jgi:hypothetical protein